MITSIDLFSGPGGLATGFRWAGIKPLIAVEWSDWTVKTYSHSHNADVFELEKYLSGSNMDELFVESDKPIVIHGDINKVEGELILKLLKSRYSLKTVDIVSGGAPCESFSIAGDRKEDDERNELYRNVLRISREVDAKLILFENVKGLFSKKADGILGRMFDIVCDDFEKIKKGKPNYRLISRDKKVVLLKASDFGVPQHRERVFLVAINKKYKNLKFNYPRPTHGFGNLYDYVNVEDALMDLPQIDRAMEKNTYKFNLDKIKDEKRLNFLKWMRGIDSYVPNHLTFDSKKSLSSHKTLNHRDKIVTRMSLVLPGENMKRATDRLIKEGKEDLVKEFFPQKIYAARNRRLELNQPSCTVTSHCLDELIHPIMNRGLTPREVARLQSFPDWYQFEGPYVKFHSDPEQDRYEQIGDAIPPLLAYAIGVELSKSLLSLSYINKTNIKNNVECEVQLLDEKENDFDIQQQAV